MSITSFKITDSDISSKGVVAAPTVLSGSPEENKRIFDRLVREVLKGDFNALVDALAATTGAGEIGAAVEGLTGETVQAILSALKTLLDSKAASADMEAALGGKSDTSVTDTHIKSVAFDAGTGVFTFTKENGTTVTVDTALEKVAVNFAYDEDTQSLVLTLADGSTQRVSLAAFLTTTEFEDSNTIEWSVSGSMVRATIKSGSITDAMLSSTLKTMLQGYVSAAANSATNAAASEAASLSYQTAAQEAAAAAAESRDQAASSQTAAAGSAAAAKSDADRAAAASAHQPRISSDGYWELWDLTQGVYVKTAYQAQGPAGDKGDSGDSYTVKGLYTTLSALQAAHPTGSAGDAWFVGTAEDNVVYQWDVDQAKWVNVGALKGPQGDTGAAGADGKSAYASAKGGGYTGTEAQFNTDLAAVGGKQSKITASGILKGDGAGGVSAAVKGTDYAAPSVGVTATLSASGWDADAKTQTVSVAGVTATANGSLRIAQSATDEQFTAWGTAQPRVTAQADGSITVKLVGTVPTIDIPVEVLIV